MTVWQNRMFRKCFAGRPYPRDTRENQLSPSCPDSLHSSHMQGTCITSRDAYSRAIHKNTLVFNLPWVFTLSLFHTQPLQINPTWTTGYKRLNRIIIKFGTKLKPTKYIVVNYNFTEHISQIIIWSYLLDINIATLLELMCIKEFWCNMLGSIALDIASSNLSDTSGIIFV